MKKKLGKKKRIAGGGVAARLRGIDPLKNPPEYPWAVTGRKKSLAKKSV